MTKAPPAEIRIDKRTVHLGNAVYSLATISRVRVKRIVPSGPAPVYRLLEILGYVVAFLIFVLAVKVFQL
ncbi:hypothetical protein [Amycolatopsis sp. lyj-109]|uniref:hypothetical protein n=1 Tax=Amycolatopsis sp. lyj-109 TaxID=2789287 RepID=UPI003978D918